MDMFRSAAEGFTVDVNGKAVALTCKAFGVEGCNACIVGVATEDGTELGAGVWDAAADLTPWVMLHVALAPLYVGATETLRMWQQGGADAVAEIVPIAARIAVAQAASSALGQVGAFAPRDPRAGACA